MCVFTVGQIVCVVKIVLQSDTREFRRMKYKYGRETMAIRPEGIVVSPANALTTTAGVLVANAGRPAVVKTVYEL